MKNRCFWFILLLFLGNEGLSASDPKGSTISLDGIWKFKSDMLDIGLQSNGVQMFPSFSEWITLPGSTDEAGKGNLSRGMTSIRLTRLYEYKGPAWYEKEIFIPENWKNKNIVLYLERVHWESRLWVNEKYVGTENSLSTPHQYRISHLLKPGQINKIRLRVDNSLIYNVEYSHAISAETQTNWNGIIGKIELQAFDKIFLDDIQVFPDVKNRKAKIRVRIANPDQILCQGTLNITGGTEDKSLMISPYHLKFEGKDSLIFYEFDLPLGKKIKLWDEFSPTLYRLQVAMDAQSINGAPVADKKQVTFGMREIGIKETRFTMNDREIFIRGTVHSAEFPLTGYPSMDEKAWEHIVGTCKNYGLNCIRFHSWCPPKAAFTVADRLGFYLQVENSDWRFLVGQDAKVDTFLKKESDRIFEEYGNHPSFVFFCEGNEMCGPKVKEFLSDMVNHWKRDPRHVYTGSAAYPYVPENQFNVLYGARPHRWKEGLKSQFNVAPLNTEYDYSEYIKKYLIPMITHEIGQWCAYPNYNEIEKYTGVLKPYNYQMFRESLREHHLLDMAEKFTMASGRFQLILKKEEFESYLRTPGMAGYHLLQLNDFPGQGTSPVGVVDVFWDPKPYVTADEFRQMQAFRLPLLRTSSFVWTNDVSFTGKAEIANYGSSGMKSVSFKWQLKYPDGKIYAQGNFSKKDIPVGSPYPLGDLNIPLQGIKKATQMELLIKSPSLACSNRWKIWVYPKTLSDEPLKSSVKISSKWDQETKSSLKEGATVVLLADTADIKSSVQSCFSGISWNAVWSGMPPELLGILCEPSHPAFAEFPTEFHSDWQWWDLVMSSKLIGLDKTPSSFRPLVQMIPDWNKNNRLGLLIEAKVGKGNLLLVSIDLTHNMENRPVARQFLYSLKRYVNSSAFAPKETLPESSIDEFFNIKKL